MPRHINRSRTALIVTLTLFAAVCAGCEVPLPEASSKEVKLYTEKCGLCHKPKHPVLLSPKEWEGIIPVMEARAKEAGVRPPLNDEERRAILGYLKKHSRRRAI